MMRPSVLHLDHNATTPLHPRVRDAMVAFLDEHLGGNPSSLHSLGREARAELERSREAVAQLLDVDPADVTFTSGGTESNNLALLGDADRTRPLWITAVEHPSVREAARRRWADGAPGGELPVDGEGRLDRAIEERRDEFDGALVSLQWVNNEVGTIQDLPRWSRWFRECGATVHTDGAQGFFRLPETIPELEVDLATITAHKSFGPVGVGALWVRRGAILDPILKGGPQEKKVRPGTENLLAIVGFAELARIAQEAPLWDLASLREKAAGFRSGLASIEGLRVISPEEGSYPSCVSVTIDELIAETVLVRLDLAGIAASSGSACSSGAREPSHVLAAMAVPDAAIRGAIRFSFGPSTSADDLARVVNELRAIVDDLRQRRRENPGAQFPV